MDGNVAPLREICDLAGKYNALVFVDECHATGFFGKTGRGTEEFCDIMGRIDIINSTLGKALGGASGGYTTGSKELIEILRQKSRPYLFSNSLPPPVVASGIKVLNLFIIVLSTIIIIDIGKSFWFYAIHVDANRIQLKKNSLIWRQI